MGEVYQVIHKQTSELFALKRVDKHQAELVSSRTPHLCSGSKPKK